MAIHNVYYSALKNKNTEKKNTCKGKIKTWKLYEEEYVLLEAVMTFLIQNVCAQYVPNGILCI